MEQVNLFRTRSHFISFLAYPELSELILELYAMTDILHAELVDRPLPVTLDGDGTFAKDRSIEGCDGDVGVATVVEADEGVAEKEERNVDVAHASAGSSLERASKVSFRRAGVYVRHPNGRRVVDVPRRTGVGHREGRPETIKCGTYFRTDYRFFYSFYLGRGYFHCTVKITKKVIFTVQ